MKSVDIQNIRPPSLTIALHSCRLAPFVFVQSLSKKADEASTAEQVQPEVHVI
jgi:hypothetical protein